MDISKALEVNFNILDTLVQQIPSWEGTTTNSKGATRIHLANDASDGDQSRVQSILDHWGSLSLSVNTSEINEDDPDPTITCEDTSISDDIELGYIVLLDGEVYVEGTTSVTAGVAMLNLVSPVAGIYDVCIYRMAGNYASASIQITVNEV